MRFVLFLQTIPFLLTISGASAQTPITFDPEIVTHCTSGGLGSGTVTWNYPAAKFVQVRINAVDGPRLIPGMNPATSIVLDPQGSAPVVDQVTDGMVFLLTDGGAVEYARTSPVIVRCNPAGEVLTSATATASYFPLQVGDEWIYRYDSRIGTASYLTRRIVKADFIGLVTWFVMEESFNGGQPSSSWFRNDDAGRIYQLTSRGEQLWLDPSTTPDPSASLTVTSRGGAVQVPAGRFQDSLNYRAVSGGLDLETGAFARGIGLVMNSHDMLTGSSGGFTSGVNLVYARIDGHVVFGPPAVSLELAVEASSLDVTNKQTTNCAVPCYFVACGLAPGADPPGTYKPCFQARVRMGQVGSDIQACDLDLLDSSNQSVFHSTLIGTSDSQSVVVQQVSLYTVASPGTFPPTIVPIKPGPYRLRAQTPDGRVSMTPIQVK